MLYSCIPVQSAKSHFPIRGLIIPSEKRPYLNVGFAPGAKSGRVSPHVFQRNLSHSSQEQEPKHCKQQFLRPRTIMHHMRLVTKRGFSISGDAET
jgi:hypothetical protein